MDKNNRFDNSKLIENRQVRIFLSSTFSDMQEERSELVKTFNKLKIEANRRNVAFSVLDLRWGITDEEARSGKVLSVCLNEIEHSHPFFIGLLGTRYGYAPKHTELEKNPDLLERYPWLGQDIADELSITEMEIQYGVLRNNANLDAVFFIKKSDIPDDNPRLTTLKTKIREQKLYPVENYSSVDVLCGLVEKAVLRLLDYHFPIKEVTPLDSERSTQRAYINSRHAHYLRRQSYFNTIDDFVRSDERHLVYTGESGIGKSALLANWVKENEDNDEFNLVYHFVGNSFSGNCYESILKHLCNEIYERYSIEKTNEGKEDLVDETQRLVAELREKDKSLIIVIDGINQITATKDEKLVLWLPAANEKVKFIFSTLREDETMQSFERRGFRIEEVIPLNREERKQFVSDYLSDVGKKLNAQQLSRIVDDSENENMLVLKTLLDELICFGSHERIDERIDYYLSAESIPNFFCRVLQRMEEDYSAMQDLVRHSLTLIALSEHGLSEDELLAVLGCRPYDWHLFYCAFFSHLVVKDGLLSFSHTFMSTAVDEWINIADKTAMTHYRHEIVTYFATLPNSDRRTSELAHQYYHLADWDNLYTMLSDFDSFFFFYKTNQFLLGLYWRTLQEVDKTKYPLSVYLQRTSETESQATTLIYISNFITTYIADYQLAQDYNLKALSIHEKLLERKHPNIASSYANIGNVYYCQEDFHNALEYYFKALVIYEETLGKHHPCTATSYGNIGLAYEKQFKFQEALNYQLEALRIRIRIFGEEHPDVANSYNNIGQLYGRRGDMSEAQDYLLKALKLCELLYGKEHPNTSMTYNNLGWLHNSQSDYSKALEYFTEALAIREKVIGPEHPDTATSYNNIGGVYYSMGDYSKALGFYFKALTIKEKVLGEKNSSLAVSYNNIGTIYCKMHQYADALEYHSKALQICKDVFGDENQITATTYSCLGAVYSDQGNYSQALELISQALKIQEKKLGKEHLDTAASYNNLGSLLCYQSKYSEALNYLFKSLEIRERKLGNEHSETCETYRNIQNVYDRKGDYPQAIFYGLKVLAINIKTLGENNPVIARSYNIIGMLYRKQNDFPNALEYYYKALEIRKDVLGTDHEETANSYNNIGEVYYTKGELRKALKYYLMALDIYKRVHGMKHSLTANLYYRIGAVYYGIRDYRKALFYLKKSLPICELLYGRKHENTQNTRNAIAAVKSKMSKR